MAILDSVTVSMGLLTNGVLSVILRVRADFRSCEKHTFQVSNKSKQIIFFHFRIHFRIQLQCKWKLNNHSMAEIYIHVHVHIKCEWSWLTECEWSFPHATCTILYKGRKAVNIKLIDCYQTS